MFPLFAANGLPEGDRCYAEFTPVAEVQSVAGVFHFRGWVTFGSSCEMLCFVTMALRAYGVLSRWCGADAYDMAGVRLPARRNPPAAAGVYSFCGA